MQVKSQPFTAPTAPVLRVLTPEQAKASKYKAISNPVSRDQEAAIFESMEASLATCDAVWIDQGKGRFSAARRASDLWTDG